MQNALGLVRAIHYGACTGLFGLCLFGLYAQGLRWSRRWALGLALAALFSALAWFALVTQSLADKVDLAAIGTVVTETSFGKIWLARLGLALIACALTWPKQARRTALTAGSGLLLVSIGLTGHTQVHEGWRAAVHVGSDMLHLACAGAWLGGLIGLTLILANSESRAAVPADVDRFSRVAQAAVAGLVVSGLVNAVMLIGSLRGLVGSQYGRQLFVKLAFVAAMLAIAAINRFSLTPRLAGPQAGPAIRGLRRNVLIEQALGIGVLLSVGWLGLSEPPA